MPKQIEQTLFIFTCRAGKANHAYVVGSGSQLLDSDIESIIELLKQQLPLNPTEIGEKVLYLSAQDIFCVVQGAKQYSESRTGYEFIVILGSAPQESHEAIEKFLRSKAQELNDLVTHNQIDWETMKRDKLTLRWVELDLWLKQAQSSLDLSPAIPHWREKKLTQYLSLGVLLMAALGFYFYQGTEESQQRPEINKIQAITKKKNDKPIETSVKEDSKNAVINIPELCESEYYEKNSKRRPALELYCKHKRGTDQSIAEWLISKNVIKMITSLNNDLKLQSKWNEDFRNWFKKSSHDLCTKETRLYVEVQLGKHNRMKEKTGFSPRMKMLCNNVKKLSQKENK
jgi:hypothetical protein